MQTRIIQLPGDTFTPVGIYLRLRDVYPHSLLLECTDYSSRENAFSYIAIQPIAGVEATESEFVSKDLAGVVRRQKMQDNSVIPALVDEFLNTQSHIQTEDTRLMPGMFGYTSYDAINAFDNVAIQSPALASNSIPLLRYDLYQVVIAFNHFNSVITLTELLPEGAQSITSEVVSILANRNNTFFPFSTSGKERVLTSNEDFMEQVNKCKAHCARGDVFQIVLSRKYEQDFQGDEFNVYRALRSINPSPYLFYFDFLDFKLFGSSPEIQLQVSNGRASINPIAGTVVRSGDPVTDANLVAGLLNDPKENSEHAMLVDLARNDLSRHARMVEIDFYKQVHTYSHVIHLASTVSGQLEQSDRLFRLFADTFPAGTLSGAPKHRAVQLIDEIEGKARGFYGGAIGVLGFGNTLNQAIMIRSFMSRQGTLYYQAGAGIVMDSQPLKELNEVDGKISALRKAIAAAHEQSNPGNGHAIMGEKSLAIQTISF